MEKGNEMVLSLSNAPKILEFGKELKGYIQQNSLSSAISGKQYAHVDAWKYAGMNFGLTALVSNPVAKHTPGQYIKIAFINIEVKGRNGIYLKEVPVYAGFTQDSDQYNLATSGKTIVRTLTKPYFAYECECSIERLNDGRRVSTGTGLCSNLELTKVGFDEYAVNSMAQTRAIGKGYRNIIGYVMNAAGMETTPAEEMEETKSEANANKKSAKAQTQKTSGKPKMRTEQFKKAIVKANKGDVNMETIEKSFELTEEQRTTFKVIFDKK